MKLPVEALTELRVPTKMQRRSKQATKSSHRKHSDLLVIFELIIFLEIVYNKTLVIQYYSSHILFSSSILEITGA